jgi:hypothetical protein
VSGDESHVYDSITVKWDASRPGRYWVVTFTAGGEPREVVSLHSEELADLAEQALNGLMHLPGDS